MFELKQVYDLETNLTPDELRELSVALGNKLAERNELEEEKKRVASQFAARLKILDGRLAEMGETVVSGKEYRAVECVWQFDTPEVGQKRLLRLDTYQVVREGAMNPTDRDMVLAAAQQTIPFEEGLEPEAHTEGGVPLEDRSDLAPEDEPDWAPVPGEQTEPGYGDWLAEQFAPDEPAPAPEGNPLPKRRGRPAKTPPPTDG